MVGPGSIAPYSALWELWAMTEILNPGDRCRVLGVIRGTVILRQFVGGVYSYLIDVDNGARGEYPASVVERIGEAAGPRCEAEKAVDLAWAKVDDTNRRAVWGRFIEAGWGLELYPGETVTDEMLKTFLEWEKDRNEAERIARERALHLTLGDNETDWLYSD
jgi:hypothetical protein